MTFSLPSPSPAGSRARLRRLAWPLCALAGSLPAATLPVVVFRPAPAVARPSAPYLVASEPASIRFAPPPPDLTTAPPAAAPPRPGGPLEEIASTNRAAQLPPVPDSAPAPDEPMPSTAAAASAASASAAAPVDSAAVSPPPPALLPDDLRPELRLEDVLPFFQPPGDNLILAVPPSVAAPHGPALAPSSATYRQQ